MSSKKTRVFKSLIAIFYYKNLCIKIYLTVLDFKKSTPYEMFNFSYCEFF